jgi:hypothetical protein
VDAETLAIALRQAIAWGDRQFDRERSGAVQTLLDLRGSLLALEERISPMLGDDGFWELRRRIDHLLEGCDRCIDALGGLSAIHALDRVRALAVDLELAQRDVSSG